MPFKNVPLGQILIEANLITKQQLDQALEIQKTDGTRKLGEILVNMGALGERDQMKALEDRFKIPLIDLNVEAVDPKAPALIPENIAVKYNIIPVGVEGKYLTVATSDPMNFYALDDVRLVTNMEVRVVLASYSDIKAAIGKYYSRTQAEKAAKDLSREFDGREIEELSEQVGERVDNAPVVRLVNSMIQQAVKLGASDIHIEPMEESTRVRIRIDGVMRNQMTLAAGAHASIVTRLKIMGNMNIAERRIPQDGRVETVIDGQPVDLRLSVLPTVTGEKVVIRILGGTGTVLDVDDLGLSERNRGLFEQILKNSNGIILICGPTGSGKTTTLYSMLNTFNDPGVNIITIEDPVEYRMPGINQVQVNPKAGLTFASGLRSILRQDPDIIMVGEIRDSETAQIAVRAAITGHLVLSTIHTNDAASTVSRLVNMDVEPYLVSSAVTGIVAQRLVKRVCPKCGVDYLPGQEEMRQLGLTAPIKLRHGLGCNYCDNTGYKGRAAVHEIIVMSQKIRELVENGASADEIREISTKSGTVTLQESCRELVLKGLTTTEEMMRATYNI